MNPCKKCTQKREIKDTFGCCSDRLHNAWEDLKCEFLKGFKDEYIPEYQCRYAEPIGFSKIDTDRCIDGKQVAE